MAPLQIKHLFYYYFLRYVFYIHIYLAQEMSNHEIAILSTDFKREMHRHIHCEPIFVQVFVDVWLAASCSCVSSFQIGSDRKTHWGMCCVWLKVAENMTGYLKYAEIRQLWRCWWRLSRGFMSSCDSLPTITPYCAWKWTF